MSRPNYLPLPQNRSIAKLGLGTWIVLLVVAALVAAAVAAGVAFLVFAGSAKPPSPPDKWAPMPVEPQPPDGLPEAMGVPDWYLNPPQEPGRAFYAVGMVDRVQGLLLGKRAAEARAKEELAGVLTTRIQSVLKDWVRDAESEDGPPADEQERVFQRVARSVVNEVISKATIVKLAFGNPRPDGTYPAFALARVRFDVVVTELRKQASKNLERTGGLEALDALLEAQSERTPNPTQMPSGPGR